MRELEKFTSKDLEAELKHRKELERQEILRQREECAKHLFSKIDALLSVVDQHSRTSCRDDYRTNYERCTRCFLLDTKDGGYWPVDADLILYISI